MSLLKLVKSKAEYAPLWLKWREHASSKAHNPLLNDPVDRLAQRLSEEGSSLSQIYAQKSFRWFLKIDSQLIGSVSLSDINSRMKTAEFGYHIAPEYQGEGWGGKGLSLLFNNVFNETTLERLYGTVAATNLASRKCLENLGLFQDGVLREHFIIETRRVDVCVYSLLRREWNLFKS